MSNAKLRCSSCNEYVLAEEAIRLRVQSFCSDDCARSYQVAQRKRKKARKARRSNGNGNGSGWRAKVLERDGYRCRLCGTTRNLSAHHLIFRSHLNGGANEKYKSDPRNGLTLCSGFSNGCHEAVHQRKQQIPITALPDEVIECLAEQGLRWVSEDDQLVPVGKLAVYFC